MPASPGLRVELYVTDIEVSRRFYEDVLGFTPTKIDGAYRSMQLEGNRLAIQAITELEATHHLRRAAGPVGLGIEVILEVSDLEAVAAAVDQAEWPRTAIVDQPWGLADFRIADPDDYYLRITTSRAS